TAVTASADSYVNAGATTTNYGSATTLRTDSSPVNIAYLQFVVPALTGTVGGVALRLYPNSPNNGGVAAYAVAPTAWTEKGITYQNAPALASRLSTSGKIG